MMKPKPVRVLRDVSVEYPTLREFADDRRAFLKRVALGAVAVGFVGPLSACLSEEQRDPQDVVHVDDPDAFGDTGSDSTSPHPDASPDSFQPDTYQEEMPSPGGMPMPELYGVRLPGFGAAATYIALDGYLTWSVTFQTYDYEFQSALIADEQAGINACVQVLVSMTCEELGPNSDLSVVHAALIASLSTLSESLLGWRAGIENLVLTVESCEAMMPIDGDMPDPNYP